MFDVGFWEILLILVLALVVIGPERLPGAARKAGFFVGKARRYVEGVRSEVESELDVTEFKRLLHNQEVQINELQQQIKTGVSDVKSDLSADLPDDISLSDAMSDVLDDTPTHSFQDESTSDIKADEKIRGDDIEADGTVAGGAEADSAKLSSQTTTQATIEATTEATTEAATDKDLK